MAREGVMLDWPMFPDMCQPGPNTLLLVLRVPSPERNLCTTGCWFLKARLAFAAKGHSCQLEVNSHQHSVAWGMWS